VSRETERAAITGHFALNWNPADGPVAYPNHEFTTPTNQMFAVLSIVESGTFRKSLGYAQYLKRSRGILQVDIYTPLGLGTKKSRLIGERLERVYDTFDMVTSDGERICFETPSSRTLPLNEQRAANLDDNWDRYVFQAPFYRDIIVTK
jgi:hypothetical protein